MPCGLAVRERAGVDERLERHDLGPDEVLLEVRVDRGGRLHGVRPLRDRPRAALVLARRQERHEAEEVVGGAQQPVQRAVRQAEVLEELGLVLGRHRGDLLLDRGRDGAERDVRLALPRVELRASAIAPARSPASPSPAFRITSIGFRVRRPKPFTNFSSSTWTSKPRSGSPLSRAALKRTRSVLLGLELGRLLLHDVPLDALEAVRDDGEVREEHLRLEELEVARRVDGALGVRHRVGGEARGRRPRGRPSAQLGEVQALRSRPSRRRGRPRTSPSRACASSA